MSERLSDEDLDELVKFLTPDAPNGRMFIALAELKAWRELGEEMDAVLDDAVVTVRWIDVRAKLRALRGKGGVSTVNDDRVVAAALKRMRDEDNAEEG